MQDVHKSQRCENHFYTWKYVEFVSATANIWDNPFQNDLASEKSSKLKMSK